MTESERLQQSTGVEATVLAVGVSGRRGVQKHPVERIHLRPHHGIDGDAHAGDWHRQVSLLGAESVDALRKKVTIPLTPGVFAENILCRGIRLHRLPVGTRLRIGSAVCEITQIGKECHTDCVIRKLAGDCVMPREGVFAVVLEEGDVSSGDRISILPQ